ncbi:MAG: RelA/SpoT family protein [Bacteroidia bacterium]|nr:RelA/SpoT family protein [Bacteroidia bacterium]
MSQEAQVYEQSVLRAYRGLLRKLTEATRAERKMFRKAFEVANKAHSGVFRRSGEPYILHPLAVARILCYEMGVKDPTSMACALLHDVVEDTHVTIEEIRRDFGDKAAAIIDGLTKITNTKSIDTLESEQAENFRKVLMTISDDLRVILIKLADRLHNMRTLGAMRQESMLKISSETLYIYAPLAHRLGLYEVKTELEDLAFKYLQPEAYQEIARKLKETQEEAQTNINKFIQQVKKALEPTGLRYNVISRYKTIYSIYHKIVHKQVPFEEIYDKYAIRIILETREGREKEDCWQVYGIISGLYTPNPKRLRDWITVPRENHYESLHTTLRDRDLGWVEVQIRTTRMDEIAERGVAAHWKYKENGEKQDDLITTWISYVRDILKNPDKNALEAVREFHQNLPINDVYAYTPKGKIIRLPRGATALDFAYHIHSKIGNMAIGAKVNNRVVGLETVLRIGDHVEILTSPRVGRPQKEWLRFIKTSRAEEHIKTALKRIRKEDIERGREIFLRIARRFEIDENHPYMRELLIYFNIPLLEDFFVMVAHRRVEVDRIDEFIQLKKDGGSIEHRVQEELDFQENIYDRLAASGLNPDMLILGSGQNIDERVLGECCNPLPDDPIVAIDEGTRIVIHRIGCQEAQALMSSFGRQIIRAQWAEGHAGVEFLTEIKVVGIDKQGMLNDLVRVISIRCNLNLRKVTIESRDSMFEGIFHVYVRNSAELSRLLDRLRRVPNVSQVIRTPGKSELFQPKVHES